ncbi:NtaA/DmoA family FMN-dependent monooxygenase [Pseudomonas sp. ABC1]|uniref:NtaA/DmoA family FMN-dependent monooxygenase n=1 Tax=Pseudomonas sp. ABC1 TaxID=2748080 RepID=UPI0015C3F82F|nr:NtaA/DmoA family FMN-dependent monooxygenase [Pseudomonas sp. ABC1]QLF94071.1 NtaA/DmoA family FMN-dependent monooxygenase [Pseudomonas sp. ABC1]
MTQLCIGLSLATTWLSGNGWRLPDSRVESIHDSDFYIDIAKRAERAKLDFLFRPDSLFIDSAALEHSPGFSSLDPTLLLAAIARETSHIGLVSTASTTFNAPYAVARQIQSLNWLSRGRAGWNIVTALDGNRNFGEHHMPSSEQRYAKAREFTEVVQRLWDSYPHASLLHDRETGRYADAAQVRPIDHQGQFFDVQGPLGLPAHPARIPLLQAGASDVGRDFSARVADAVFAATPDIAAGVELRQDLRQRAQRHGRQPGDIRVLPGLSLFLGETAAQARELYRQTHAQQNLGRRYDFIQEALGLDVRQLPQDLRLTAQMLPDPPRQVRSRTHADLLRRLVIREQPSVAELLARPEVAGSAHWIVVGTAADAVEEIVQRHQAGAIDGFVALPGGALQSLHLCLDELVPALVERGLFRRDYSGSTFAEHLGLGAVR